LWKPIIIIDELKQSPLEPNEFIYGSYDGDPKLQTLFKVYPTMSGKKQPFTGVMRVKLIISIMEARQLDQGCGLNLRELMLRKCLLAQFPIHDYDELKALQKKWLKLFEFPWSQPIDAVKDYFGERIGFYFFYLQHYVELLMIPALLGLVTYIVRAVYGKPENFLMPYYAVVVTIWSTFYLEFWKRKQATKSMEWGVTGFEDEEEDRPQYTGVIASSPVDGADYIYFPSAEKNKRVNIVLFCIACCILGVICTVSGVFFFQVYMNKPENKESYIIMGVNFAPIIVSIANTVAIMVCNMLYRGTAAKLNDYENHRTDTAYEDNLIAKIFVFQLINSFAALTYVAFIKSFIGIRCINNNCIGDASATISTVFVSGLISRAINEVIVRKITQNMKYAAESGGVEPGLVMSPLEEQYVLAEYDMLNGTLNDYAALVIQYGYTVLFVAAFPLAPTLAFVSGYIQIRVDGWKLCQAFRRPQPKTAEDIGVWQNMLEIISILSVIYNFALIFFTSHYLIDIRMSMRWIMFILVEHVLFVIKFYLAEIIPDVPEFVETQLARQELYYQKVVENLEDDVDEITELEVQGTNLIIADTDIDWDGVEKEGDEEKDSKNDEEKDPGDIKYEVN